MNTSRQSENSLQQSPIEKIDSAIRAAWKSAIRGLYRIWARTYETTMVSRLGYQAPEFVAEALSARMPAEKARVLDVGCGTGLTALALLQHRSDDIDGIDFSPEMLERARERGIYNALLTADVTRPLPVGKGTYDAAISSGLFTHGHVGAEAIPHILKAIRRAGCSASPCTGRSGTAPVSPPCSTNWRRRERSRSCTTSAPPTCARSSTSRFTRWWCATTADAGPAGTATAPPPQAAFSPPASTIRTISAMMAFS